MGGLNEKGHEGILRVRDGLLISTGDLVTRVNAAVRTHQTVHLSYVQLTVCKSHCLKQILAKDLVTGGLQTPITGMLSGIIPRELSTGRLIEKLIWAVAFSKFS